MIEAASVHRRAHWRGPAVLVLLACATLSGCDNATKKPEGASGGSGAAVPAASTAPAPIAIAHPIAKETGYAWIVPTDVNPAQRKLRVFEGDRELGPGDSIHDDVRKKGLGAYSHWDTGKFGYAVYFSTSDNSDPNTNGRVYSLR